jgi:hypothetical protein
LRKVASKGPQARQRESLTGASRFKACQLQLVIKQGNLLPDFFHNQVKEIKVKLIA